MKLIDQFTMYCRANPEKKLYKIADEIGISRSVLYEWIRGKRDIMHNAIAEKIREYIEK